MWVILLYLSEKTYCRLHSIYNEAITTRERLPPEFWQGCGATWSWFICKSCSLFRNLGDFLLVPCCLCGRKRHRREPRGSVMGLWGSPLYSGKSLPFFISTRVPPFLRGILYSINSWRYCQRLMWFVCILNNRGDFFNVVICLDHIFCRVQWYINCSFGV